MTARGERIRMVLHGVGVAAVLGAGVAIAVLLLGLASVTATSGHFAATDWLLHAVLRRAVAMQSLGIEPPPLEEPARVAEGAGHYELGCAPCHGRPGAAPPAVPGQMVPPPPYLPPAIADWSPRELFFIVKHGVKFTGMPAWVSQRRDDEVWSVVAFLLRLPELDTADYLALAFGAVPPAAAGGQPRPAASDVCARCHGSRGRGRGLDAFPRLAGLEPEYLHATLQSYAAGRRPSGIMQPVAAALDGESMQRIAAYYGGVTAVDSAPPRGGPPAPSDVLRERGRRIAVEGIPARDVAPCAYCHGPDRVSRNPLFPQLAGQPQAYLERQLALWTSGGHGGTPFAGVMHEAAKELAPRDIEAVAAYYAELPRAP